MANPTPSNRHPLIAALIAIVWVAAVYAADGWFGLSAMDRGWLWLALAYGVGFLLASQLLDNGLAAILGLIIALGLGYAHYRTSPGTPDQLLAVADEVRLPDGWSVVRSDATGNPWCWQGCPELTRSYNLPGPYDEERDRLLKAMKKSGWKTSAQGTSDAHLTRDRWDVYVDAAPAGGKGQAVLRFRR